MTWNEKFCLNVNVFFRLWFLTFPQESLELCILM